METSEQILLAASELFALRGYHKVTVASICRKVGINVASVSYHFGGKQNLYAEVWRHLYAESQKVLQSIMEGASSPEQRLFALLRYKVSAALSSPGKPHWFTRLSHYEVADPSPLHNQLVRDYLMDVRERYVEVIKSFLGEDVDPVLLYQALLFLHEPIADLLRFRISLEIKSISDAGKCPFFEKMRVFNDDPEKLLQRLYNYVLAGLRALQGEREDAK
ncbi:MAG: TetR/AcrR family transcriptional regulator [Lentisphaeria bacterium]|nr:TetR/AcrR family transcriptional regulator [Lentisphaeria bacterium]